VDALKEVVEKDRAERKLMEAGRLPIAEGADSDEELAEIKRIKNVCNNRANVIKLNRKARVKATAVPKRLKTLTDSETPPTPSTVAPGTAVPPLEAVVPGTPLGVSLKPDLNELQVVADFVTEEEANLIKAIECHEVKSRASTLKRAPKAEFYVGDSPVWYFFQQHKSELENQVKMPDWMEAIGHRIDQLPRFNHAIAIAYAHGEKHHAPPHRDNSEDTGGKSGCLKKGTGFAVISVGEPRTFQLMDSPSGPVVWEQKLPHRSMLWIPAEFNVAYWHCVPKDKSHTGTRVSLIFREILTLAAKSSSSRPSRKRKAETQE